MTMATAASGNGPVTMSPRVPPRGGSRARLFRGAELGASEIEAHHGAEERVRRHGEERAQDAGGQPVAHDAQDVLDGGEAERQRHAVDDAVERLVELVPAVDEEKRDPL